MGKIGIFPSFYPYLFSHFLHFSNNSTIFYHLPIQSKTDRISRPTPRGVSWRPWRPLPYIHESCCITEKSCGTVFMSCGIMYESHSIIFEGCVMMFDSCRTTFKSCSVTFESGSIYFYWNGENFDKKGLSIYRNGIRFW